MFIANAQCDVVVRLVEEYDGVQSDHSSEITTSSSPVITKNNCEHRVPKADKRDDCESNVSQLLVAIWSVVIVLVSNGLKTFKRSSGSFRVVMWLSCINYVFVGAFALSNLGEIVRSDVQEKRCIPIPDNKCTQYNTTSMPNLLGHQTVEEARAHLNDFNPLIKIECSKYLELFLCAMYYPFCDPKTDAPIGPCRPLCSWVRDRCQPMIEAFSFQWPEVFNCDLFPAKNTQGSFCIQGDDVLKESMDHPPIDPKDYMVKVLGKDNDRAVDGQRNYQPPVDRGLQKEGLPRTNDLSKKHCGHLKHSNFYIYVNYTNSCAPFCYENADILFTRKNRDDASIWHGCLSGICLLLCILASIMAITTSYRFRYPQKPVLFITLCYGLSCIGSMIRLFGGPSRTACTTYGNGMKENVVYSIYVVSGMSNINCTIVFVFAYYFGLAAILWWTVFALTWFLAVGLGWSKEAIELKTSFYHVPAWVIPGFMTVAVLIRDTVDSDELTGLCSVGYQNTEELLHFVILPHLICLVTGMALITVGFFSSICCCTSSPPKQIPNTIQGAGSGSTTTGTPLPIGTLTGSYHSSTGAAPRLDQSMLKLGMLAASYVVPSTCVLATQFYEYSYRSSWMKVQETGHQQLPSFETFVLKICAGYLFGVLTAGYTIVKVISNGFSVERYSGPHKYPAQKAPVSVNYAPTPHQDNMQMMQPLQPQQPIDNHSLQQVNYNMPVFNQQYSTQNQFYHV